MKPLHVARVVHDWPFLSQRLACVHVAESPVIKLSFYEVGEFAGGVRIMTGLTRDVGMQHGDGKWTFGLAGELGGKVLGFFTGSVRNAVDVGKNFVIPHQRDVVDLGTKKMH